jgi:hypothetical protein
MPREKVHPHIKAACRGLTQSILMAPGRTRIRFYKNNGILV